MKHLFLNTLKLGERIPVFIELRDFNGKEVSLIDFIYECMSNKQFSLKKEYLILAFKSGKFLLLLDGFDELEEEKIQIVRSEIIDLADKYDKNCYIVSSRPDSGFISWSSFTELKIQPMDKPTALELINKIHYDEDVKRKFIEQLDSELYEKHIEFTSNPLLITILLLTFEQFAEIPNEQYIFYQQAFETLYRRHDAMKGFRRKRYCENLTENDFIQVLSAFSIQGYIENQVNFSLTKVIQYLVKAKEQTGVTFDEDAYLKDLIQSVCILIEDGLLYTFAHRTFQEYFSALYISKLKDQEQEIVIRNFIKPSSIIHKFLFGLNRHNFERNFVIPALEKLAEITGYMNDKLKGVDNYIKLVRRSIIVDFDGPTIVFTTNLENRGLYMPLEGIISPIYFSGRWNLFKVQEVIRERLITQNIGSKSEEIEISISQIFTLNEYKDIKKSLIESHQYFNNCMELLVKLKEEHAKREISIGDLFKIV